MKTLLLLLLTCGLTLSSSAADRDIITFNNHLAGKILTQDDLKGKLFVAHEWQVSSTGISPSLKEFEKFARRKKGKPAVFAIWHNNDNQNNARKEAKNLRLKLPVYHGPQLKNETWPNVVIFNVEGKIIYYGLPNKEFENILNKELRAIK